MSEGTTNTSGPWIPGPEDIAALQEDSTKTPEQEETGTEVETEGMPDATSQNMNDPFTNKQDITLGLTPFSQIGLTVTDSSGESAGAVITTQEASHLAVQLIALVGILAQQAYAQAFKEQMLAQELLNNPTVWTPGG